MGIISLKFCYFLQENFPHHDATEPELVQYKCSQKRDSLDGMCKATLKLEALGIAVR